MRARHIRIIRRRGLALLAALAVAAAVAVVPLVTPPATADASSGWACGVDGGDTCAVTGGGSGFSVTWTVDLAGAPSGCFGVADGGRCYVARLDLGSPTFTYVTDASCTDGVPQTTTRGSGVWAVFLLSPAPSTVTCRITGDVGTDDGPGVNIGYQLSFPENGWTHTVFLSHSQTPTKALTIANVAISPDTPTLADSAISATVTVRNDTPDTISGVTAGVTSTTTSVVTAGAVAPASVASLAPGTSTDFTVPLTAVAAGDASLSITASATDGVNVLTATPRVRTFAIASKALSVAVTPSKASVELALDGAGAPIPMTVPVDVAVTNASARDVSGVTLQPLTVAAASVGSGVPGAVEAPNSVVALGTIAAGATVHTTRDVTFSAAGKLVATTRADTATDTASASASMEATLPGVPLTWAIDPRWDGTTATIITAPVQLDPVLWGYTVQVGAGCDESTVAQYTLSIGGATPSRLVPTATPCEFHFARLNLDPFTMDVTRKVDGTVVQTGSVAIKARDFVIAAAGDSLSSGEGLPGSTWSLQQCHRSVESGSALAALDLENGDPHTTVSYVSLACSGAATYEGLVRPYVGIEPGALIRSQLPFLAEFAAVRKIDSVIFSIGANDLQFGDVVTSCIASPLTGCGPTSTIGDGQQVGALLESKFSELPNSYAVVDQYLRAAGVSGSQIMALTYPDSTHSDVPTSTGFCESTMTSSSWRYAYNAILVPLNQAIQTAGARFGWDVLGGAEQAFYNHGYCARDPWITSLTGSLGDELALAGGFHPNAAGYSWYGDQIYQRLKATLYSDGSAVPPSSGAVHPVQASGTVSAGTVDAGSEVTVSGSGFAIGEPVNVELHSIPVLLATVVADATSAVRATVRIPAGTDPGQHSLVLIGQRTGNTTSIPITVAAASGGAVSTAGTTSLLAVTGGVIALPAAVFGAGLLLAGALLRVSGDRDSAGGRRRIGRRGQGSARRGRPGGSGR